MKVIYPFKESQWGRAQAHLIQLLSLAEEVDATILCPRGPLYDRAQFFGHTVVEWDKDFAHPRSLWEFAQLLADSQADLVHLNASRLLTWACRRKGVPIIENASLNFGTTTPSRGRLDDWISAKMDYLIADSDFMKKELMASGIPEDHITVVRNCVDTETLVPDPDNDYNTPTVIGSMGRLHPHKGFDILIEALAQVPRTHLLIGGQGDQLKALQKKADECGVTDRVSFQEDVDNPTEFLKKIHLYVQSSRWESISKCTCDALAMGLPVIATDVGGTRELIQDRVNGLLIPPEDPTVCAKALTLLIKNTANAQSMGRNGRRLINKNHHPEKWAQQILQLYRRLINK